MKQRVKIDNSLLSFAIILTGFLYLFPSAYFGNKMADNVLDFLGLFTVLCGTFFRMAARGYKKANSHKSEQLVIDGPYSVVRNPMYFGSFLMGAGFVLIVWPWWTLPLFGTLFYLRFRRQVIKEETKLTEVFGKSYTDYCQRVSRAFPIPSALKGIKFTKAFPKEVIGNTQEKRGLWAWPILAVLLESLQERLVFGSTNIFLTVVIFLSAMTLFAVIIWSLYKDA